MRERIVTLPNLLTLSRLPMAGAVWIAPRHASVVIPLMIAAAVTDLLDGRFARAVRARRERRGENPGHIAGASGMGAWLDPLCDKVFVVSLLGAIYVGNKPSLLIVLLIATRELFLVPLVVLYRTSPKIRARVNFDFRAGMAGKLATVAQFSAIALIVMAPNYAIHAAVAAGVLGLVATIVYVRRFAKSIQKGNT